MRRVRERVPRRGCRARKTLRMRKPLRVISRVAPHVRRMLIAGYWALVLTVGAVAAAFFLQAREEYLRLRQQEDAARTRLVAAQAQLAQQEQTLRRLRSDPAYVERVIRQRLGYARPDEAVFRFEQ